MSIESDIEAARKQDDPELVEALLKVQAIVAANRRAKALLRAQDRRTQLDMLNVARQRNEHICPVD